MPNFKINRNQSIIVGFLFIIAIGFLDYLTGYEYAFAVFYALPISLVTWYSTQQFGFIACIVSAIVWLWADTSTAHPYSSFFIPYWNTLIRFSFFIIIANLLSALKNSLQREKDLSLKDYLTGASNYRHFYEIVQTEIDRSKRSLRPFTLAYLDVDNFKSINDTFGHAEGDLVLTRIVSTLKSMTRNTDLIARLGGDELAVFFPDTNQIAAQIILPKMQKALLDVMVKNDWKVTFSIGVVSCIVAPSTVSELIKMADELMYSVKRNGKNMIKYSVYGTVNLAE